MLWKFWLPGFLTAVIAGVISYAVCLQSGELGFALFVAVPISVGAILGYATQTRYWVAVLLGLAATASIVAALVWMNAAGFFCGMTLSLIFMIPVLFGLLIGAIVRYSLKAMRWDQSWYLPLIGFIALPYAVQGIESSIPRGTEVATIRTDLHVQATPQEAYRAIMFYEEVEHDPPMLLNLALPKPISSEGRKDRVGEVVRCRYDRGWLVKRITRVEPGRALEFEVIEQHLHFERDVTLTGGSFRIEALPDGTSRITLTTDYERHLRPGWMWQPIERTVVHTLHEHVLEGMRRTAEKVSDENTDDEFQYPPPHEPVKVTMLPVEPASRR